MVAKITVPEMPSCELHNPLPRASGAYMPIGLCVLVRLFLLKPHSAQRRASGFAYLRPTDTSVYISPPMAVSMNTSMIIDPIDSHLLPSFFIFVVFLTLRILMVKI